MQIFLSMKDVNIGCLKTGTQQSVDRRSGVLRIDNRADDPMGRIRDEIASFMPVVVHVVALGLLRETIGGSTHDDDAFDCLLVGYAMCAGVLMSVAHCAAAPYKRGR